MNDLLKEIKKVAPGTALREALDNIIRASTGALVILGDGPEIMDMIDGGVRLNADFSPSLLYELAKMDGAIVMDAGATRIAWANVQIWPNKGIPSEEQGIRHKTAERAAIQSGRLVIAISQRRNVVTLFKGKSKYVLREISFILSKANQALQTLSNYRAALDEILRNLDHLELDSKSTLADVISAIRRMEMMWKIIGTIEQYIVELGTEGHLVKMQMDEITGNTHRQHHLIIRDYLRGDGAPEEVIKRYRDGRDIPQAHVVAEALGYDTMPDFLNLPVSPRGYRILRQIPRLPAHIGENLVKTFGNLENIVRATQAQLDAVEGIGETRAKAIQEGLGRLKC